MAKVGRPTVYKPECVDLVKDYTKRYAEFEDVMPMIEALPEVLGVSLPTIFVWKEKYPEFLEACNDLMREQKRVLLNRGLKSEINTPITIRALAANHGMAEKNETALSGSLNLGKILQSADGEE